MSHTLSHFADLFCLLDALQCRALKSKLYVLEAYVPHRVKLLV